MGKIRINELARELEVKPNRLLEMLPQFGITEKRTHSSSVDDDVADRLRRHFGFLPQEPEGAAEVGGVGEAAPAAPPEAVESGLEAAGLGRTAMAPGAPTTPASAMAPEAPGSAVSAETAALKEGLLAGRAAPQRLRPPLAGARPAVEAAPPSAAAAPVRPSAIPARPVPAAPKPGQILTGPRQPLPSIVVQTPRPAVPPSEAGRPAPSHPPTPPPAATPPARPQTRMSLAGQPAARPVVPPRADLVARLAQPKAMPGQPQPRPGRPASTPVPGQPIYRGPIRPGQTIRHRGTRRTVSQGQDDASDLRGARSPGGRAR